MSRLVDVAISKTCDGWRLDVYQAGTREALGQPAIDAVHERFPTARQAMFCAVARWGHRLATLHGPTRSRP